MKTIILASALILSTTSILSAKSADKELKKINTNTVTVVSVQNTLPVTIEANESFQITTSEKAIEKVQYTPEQKAIIVGLEFKSATR